MANKPIKRIVSSNLSESIEKQVQDVIDSGIDITELTDAVIDEQKVRPRKNLNEKDLIIPHYDWQNRLFVVEPLYEVLKKPLDKSSFKIFDQKITNIGKIKT